MSHHTTKPTKWPVRPAKTQIRLGIRLILSESSLSAAALSHILEFTDLEEEKKIYLPTNRPLSRVRGNKDIFKGSRDIAKLKAV